MKQGDHLLLERRRVCECGFDRLVPSRELGSRHPDASVLLADHRRLNRVKILAVMTVLTSEMKIWIARGR